MAGDRLTFANLKAKQRRLRSDFPQTMGLRVHRAISWIGRAEKAQDSDGRFLFLWISFNAAYADEREFHDLPTSERTAFRHYFEQIVRLDADHRVYDAIWKGFAGPIRTLLLNKFVFQPFWQHANGMEGFGDWKERFDAAGRGVRRAIQEQDTMRILMLLFDRLYVLRNQIVHGGSTWNSGTNRHQVSDGAAILGFLVPVFIDLMLDQPDEDWGRPFYPVIE